MARHDRRAGLFVVTQGGFEPVGPDDHELLCRFKLGETVELAPKRPRSRKQDALYWAMLDVVAENSDQFASARALSNAILVELGYCAKWKDIGGAIHADPMSISEFDKDEMSVLIDRAKQVIEQHILPGVDVTALCDEAWGRLEKRQ